MVKEFDIICIGAALVDIVAKVERYPISDDEVFVSDLELFSGGAAANTAYACSKLGLKVAFIGKLGYNDEFGKKIINDFKEVSLNTSLISYSKEIGTGSAYIALNENGERRIYAHSGAANVLSSNDIRTEDIIKAQTIFLSSLRNLEPFKKAASIAKKYHIPIILNPGMLIIEQGYAKLEELLSIIDILIISKREFQNLFNLSENVLTHQLIKEKAQMFFKRGIRGLIITLGMEGAMVLNSEETKLIKSYDIIHVIDTTGAGDAFSAGFIYGFVRNLSYKFKDLKSNVKFGNYIAGKCIQKLGARNGIPEADELELNSFNF